MNHPLRFGFKLICALPEFLNSSVVYKGKWGESRERRSTEHPGGHDPPAPSVKIEAPSRAHPRRREMGLRVSGPLQSCLPLPEVVWAGWVFSPPEG